LFCFWYSFLRVVESDEKRTRCLGKWAALSQEDINKESWSFRLEGDDARLTFFLKKVLLRNPKKWEPDVILQNLLRKIIAENGRFFQ
jgi:hypothetical protein